MQILETKNYFQALQIYFQGLQIYFQALKIYFQALQIYFQALKKVFGPYSDVNMDQLCNFYVLLTFNTEESEPVGDAFAAQGAYLVDAVGQHADVEGFGGIG